MIIFLNPQSESMRLNKSVTSEQKMQWLIANSLGTDLNTSVQISMKAVSSLIIYISGFTYCTTLQFQVKGIAVRVISFELFMS